MYYRIDIKLNNVEEIDFRNRTYYILDDMINIKIFDWNKVKINEKSNKNILINCIGNAATINVKYFYLIVDNINWYVEESDGNKYLTLVPTGESKYILKSMKKVCITI